MMEENGKESNHHLISLGLSVQATSAVQTLRTHLWRSTGDLSFQVLFPTIPLLWSLLPIRSLADIHLELPPTPLIFEEPVSSHGSLFLATHAPDWSTWFAQTNTAYHRIVEEPYEQEPFPTGIGIYLGRSEHPEPCNPVVNNNWRLQLSQVSWIQREAEIIHVRHTLVEERHLV